MPFTGPIPSVTANQRTQALDEAVIRIWSNLPQHLQNRLFQEAVTCHGESIRLPLAVFLHDTHPRTSGSLPAWSRIAAYPIGRDRSAGVPISFLVGLGSVIRSLPGLRMAGALKDASGNRCVYNEQAAL
jgi:hypothetical protein